MAWTLFWDMHSGGGTKEPPYEKIYIEAPEAEARVIFYNRFGHNPDRVTCTCCGNDYSLYTEPTLEEASGFHRGCGWAWFDLETGEEFGDSLGEHGVYDHERKVWTYANRPAEQRTIERGDPRRSYNPYRTVDEYVKQPDVLVIPASEIAAAERQGSVPEEGYVWVG